MKQPDKKVASPNQTCLDVGMCNEGLNYFFTKTVQLFGRYIFVNLHKRKLFKENVIYSFLHKQSGNIFTNIQFELTP